MPMVIVLLHTIIDDLEGDESKVFTMADKRKNRSLTKVSFWKMLAKVGLPTAYVVAALAILMPGFINIMNSLNTT